MKAETEKIVRPELRAPGDLIFHDTFDTLDMDVWEHEMTMNGGGNWEFQVSTPGRKSILMILLFCFNLFSDRLTENSLRRR